MTRSLGTRAALAVGLATTGMLMAAPSALGAGTVTVISFPGSPLQMQFDAGPGVADRVTVNASSTSVTITNTADVINESAAECTGGGSPTVTCNAAFGFVGLQLGDMADEYTAGGTMGVIADGGPGNDTLTGSDVNVAGESLSGGEDIDTVSTRSSTPPTSANFMDSADGGSGNDTVTGGSGDDNVSGGDGTDQVTAGAGDDQVSGGPGNSDTVDAGEGDDLLIITGGDGAADSQAGGPGIDTVLGLDSAVAPPPDAFGIDLEAGTGGRTNNGAEPDTVSGFEDAVTGIPGIVTTYGSDTVHGTSGSNLIETSGGDDTIDPRGGPDTVSAGSGNDTLDTRDGGPDTVRCGAGTDTIQADDVDTLADCENVTITSTAPPPEPEPEPEPTPTPTPTPTPVADTTAPQVELAFVPTRIARARLLRRGLRFAAGCDEACAVKIELIGRVRSARLASVGDLLLGRASLKIGTGLRKATVKVGRKLRPVVRRGARLRLRVTVTDAAGNNRVVTRKLRVR